jgi:hypothetical protein
MTTKPKQTTEPTRDPRDGVLAILVGALLSPFTGMLRALAYRLLWSWFLAPQYGEGPTLQTWFGIGVLYSLFSFRQARAGELPKNVVWHAVENAIVGLLVLGTAIVAAAMARVVWGWR